MKPIADVDVIVANLTESISRATRQFAQWDMFGEEWMDPSWILDATYLQLLAALEALGLPELRGIAGVEYQHLQADPTRFRAVDRGGPDDESYSPILARLRQYEIALSGLRPPDSLTTVTKDVLEIIRNTIYVITDREVYGSVPANENDVHRRIESVLKSVFPDLKRKPALTKQIKNFEPDTGIPSLRTLIEYKFLSCSENVASVADQVLADTRGYHSAEWDRFLYVIYETNRFRTENDWNQLLRESGVPPSTRAVVLGGEPRVLDPAASQLGSRRS